MFLNGKLISSSNNNYHHLAFIETELTTDFGSKYTWAPCQGYRYRADAKSSREVKEKALAELRKGDQFNLELYGAPHIDFLDCERLLLPGVTLHLRFYRSPNNCALESVGTGSAADFKRVDQTPYSQVIEKTSLFVNKVVLSDCVKVSIERALTKSPALYPHIESLNKSFIIQAGQNVSWRIYFWHQTCAKTNRLFGQKQIFSRINIWKHAFPLPYVSAEQN